MFNKTDSTLSSFINDASAEDLSLITSQVFNRVASLDQRQQDQFMQDVQRDPQAKPIFEQMQQKAQSRQLRSSRYVMARAGKMPARAFLMSAGKTPFFESQLWVES